MMRKVLVVLLFVAGRAQEDALKANLVPSFAEGVWNRFDNVIGETHDLVSTSVKWIQTSALFSDCRVPRDRKPPGYFTRGIGSRDPAVLVELARSTGFAGATTFSLDRAEERLGDWPGDLTWHHVVADFSDVCMDPSVEFYKFLRGEHSSTDIGAIQRFPLTNVVHEHGKPVDYPQVQYEAWANIAEPPVVLASETTVDGTASEDSSSSSRPIVAAVWPPSRIEILGRPLKRAMLFVLYSTGEFAYARDKGLGGKKPFSCNLAELADAVANGTVPFPAALPFFQTELSYGLKEVDTRMKAGSAFKVLQSTIPFRENKALQGVGAMCAAMHEAIVIDGTIDILCNELGCGAPFDDQELH